VETKAEADQVQPWTLILIRARILAHMRKAAKQIPVPTLKEARLLQLEASHPQIHTLKEALESGWLT
jgi:hypothetical protein